MQTSIPYTNREFDTVDTFPFDILQYVRPCRAANGHPKNRAKKYADIIATFDIETTNIRELKQAVMWHWQVCVDGLVCVGRTSPIHMPYVENFSEL